MILINGAPAESIAVTDRGLAYGDGVFRTLRAIGGKPLHWARQFAKLADDCQALGIPRPPETALMAEVHAVAQEHPQAVVKIIVTRGSGIRGYAMPDACAPRRVVLSSPQVPAVPQRDGIRAHLCCLRLSHQPALAGVKHLNRLENVLARSEWRDPAIGEGLLLDQGGSAIGGTMSNLFIVEGGKLYTPRLDRCGVAGVTRARVMSIAAQANIPCGEEDLPLQRVLDAHEVFFVNSVIGLWPLGRLGARGWTPGPLAAAMRNALDAEDAALV